MNWRLQAAALSVALSGPTSLALADANIGLAAAEQIAAGAVEACLERGFLVSAAVVDRAGQLKALLRADGAGPHTPESARRKAYTAVSLRNSTSAVLQTTQTNPQAANLVFIPEFLILAGGIPIRSGSDVVGAVGVGGAPGGQFDEQCAQAGIDGRHHRDNR